MTTKRTILILAANPLDTARLSLGTEVSEIKKGLNSSSGRDAFAIEHQPEVQLDELQDTLLIHNPQIVHFSGHGEEEGIMVGDGRGRAKLIPPQALTGLFSLFPQVECVLLNCCFSESQAKALSGHIPYVIGMNNSIGDEAARKFSVGFYKALGAGRSYQDAFAFGCNSIQLHDIPEDATPVLLAHPELMQKQNGTVPPEAASKQGAESIPEEYRDAYDLLQQKLKILTKARSVENDAAKKFQLDHQIAEAKKDMQQLTEW